MSESGTDYRTFRFQDKYRFSGGVRWNASVELKIFEYATLTGQYEREFYSTGMDRTTWSGDLHNSLRDPFKKLGFIQYLDMGVGAKSEVWQTSSGRRTWNQWNAILGLRF